MGWYHICTSYWCFSTICSSTLSKAYALRASNHGINYVGINTSLCSRIRLPGATTEITSSPFISKIAAAIIVIPAAIFGSISRIQWPRSLSDVNIFRNIRLPSFLSRKRGSSYVALGQDDVLLSDYDSSEEPLMDEYADADEL